MKKIYTGHEMTDQVNQNHPDHPQTGPDVTITVNGNSVTLHRGNETVVAIKTAAGISLADDLGEIIEGKLTSLADDGSVTLKGGETFISHPKVGASS